MDKSLDTVTHTHKYSLEELLNTITLGDSYKIIKDIPDKSIDLVYIDPPYEYTKGGCGKNQTGEYKQLCERKYKSRATLEGKIYGHGANKDIVKIANEIRNISDGFKFEILDELERKMKKTNIYIWCSRKQVSKLMKYYESKNYNVDLLTWHKDDPIPMCGNSYLSDTEYCIFARAEQVPLYGSVSTKKKYYVSHCNRTDKEKYLHPTIKPLEIVKNHIINSSKKNDVVLDCFSGSGTTCVACKELNRQFIGIEINPEYHRISLDRLNGILANGQISFDTDISMLGG